MAYQLGPISITGQTVTISGSIDFSDNGQQLEGTASWALTASVAPNYIAIGDINTTQTVSGSLVINKNLTVLGSQSIQYITSSQLDISTNIVTVNTATPSIRFGGLAVYDSGSTGTGKTGSMLWDSQNDVWIYSNPSGSNYDGAMILTGPKNSSGLGSEVGINTNALAKGDSSHHVTSSQITDDGTTVTVPGSLVVTGSIVGTLQGTASYATTASYALSSAGGGASEWPVTTAFQILGSTYKGYPLGNINFNNAGQGSLANNGTIGFAAYHLPTAQTITGVKYVLGTAGNFTATNYNGLGLYSINAGTLTLITSTADDGGSCFKTTTGLRTKAFPTPVSLVAGVYFIAIQVWASAVTTSPAFLGTTYNSNAVVTQDFTNSVKLGALLGGGLTALPATQTMSGMGSNWTFGPLVMLY